MVLGSVRSRSDLERDMPHRSGDLRQPRSADTFPHSVNRVADAGQMLRQPGLPRSKDPTGILNEQIKETDADRRAAILGGAVARRRRRAKASRGKSKSPLAGFAEHRTQLRARYKGRTVRASLRTDGTIYFQRKLYRSPSAAGKAAIGRSCNGWAFWKYKDRGKWVSLRSLR